MGGIIHRACTAKGWTDQQVADAATEELPAEVDELVFISTAYVTALRGVTRQPLGTPTARLKFAAVIDALGIDRATANRLAGGI